MKITHRKEKIMGNRAVITCRKELDDIGLYLHWNGGPSSVTGFLTYCKMKGYTSPERSGSGWVRLSQVIGNFIGGTDSVEIDQCSCLDYDNHDNGTYVIKDWTIVERLFKHGSDDNYDLKKFMLAIDSKMPEKERIAPYIKAVEMGPDDKWKVGDTAYLIDWKGDLVSGTVEGFTEKDGKNVPYTNIYPNGAENSNNLIIPDINGRMRFRRKLRPKSRNN